MILLTNDDFQWGRSEVVIIYPESMESQMLHVCNIYLHLPQKWPSFVGKYASTMVS